MTRHQGIIKFRLVCDFMLAVTAVGVKRNLGVKYIHILFLTFSFTRKRFSVALKIMGGLLRLIFVL